MQGDAFRSISVRRELATMKLVCGRCDVAIEAATPASLHAAMVEHGEEAHANNSEGSSPEEGLARLQRAARFRRMIADQTELMAAFEASRACQRPWRRPAAEKLTTDETAGQLGV
jgi:hypothetical protein